MMMDILLEQIAGAMTPEVSQQSGIDAGAATQAVEMLIPILTAALARNASSPDGAEELSNALRSDHDGSLLDDLSGYILAPDKQDGDGILGHVLGGQRSDAEKAVSQSTGLDPKQVAQILATLAPIVLAYLGRQQREQHLEPSDLSDMLAGERRQLEKKPPPALGGLAGMLDADQDGDVTDDAARIGMGLLVKWLNKS
jgi:hypothetical protein